MQPPGTGRSLHIMTTDTTLLLSDLRAALGDACVLTGEAAAPYRIDWMGDTRPEPLAVLRPADTGEVSKALQCALRHGTPSCRSPAIPG